MRILIIGLGSIAHKHIEAIRMINTNSEFYALRSSIECNSENGVVNIFDKQQVLDLDIDFVIISNPTSEHTKTISWVSDLNIPMFIEKPLSNNLQIDNVVSKCNNTLTYVACNLRFLECLQWLKKSISGKIINEVNAYCGSYLPDWRQGVDWRRVYSANKAMGGGVHIDLIHEIDYIYWLFGKPESITKVFRNRSSLNIDAHDYANYCMIYDKFAVSAVLNYYRRDYKRTLEIVFDNETWVVDLSKNCVFCDGNILFQGSEGILGTYKSQMSYFIDLIDNNKKSSMNSISEAYNVLKICLEDEITR